MIRVYRIVSPQYPPFDGGRARRWGSRWISSGRWVVHTAETYALAVLENLVHWQTSSLPPTLVCVMAEIPDDIEQEQFDPVDFQETMRKDYALSREIGDGWYGRAETAVLWIPSVVSPYENNVLFNQKLPEF